MLIGWGYGCTDKKCYGQKDRSVVWVAPSANADIYVDLSNTGKPDGFISLRALQSVKITDPHDDDMSGALIYAVEPGTGPNGPGVDLAAAWGQDPSVSYEYQGISMDLGTTVLPLTTVNVAKLVDKPTVRPGEELVYTIRIANMGQRLLDANTLTILDELDSDVLFVEGSMRYVVNGVSCAIQDSHDGSQFPLGGSGLTIPVEISRRGGSIDIIFKVLVSMNVGKEYIVNDGQVSLATGETIPYRAVSVVTMEPGIELSNKVYGGFDGGEKCGKGEATEMYEGRPGDQVTYCFVITNTGRTSLDDISLTNDDLGFSQTLDNVLAPGESATLSMETTATGSLLNTAEVTANPSFSDGTDIETLADVTASDTSQVELTSYLPAILLENTVKRDDGSSCASSFDHLEDIVGTAIQYCFKVRYQQLLFLSQLKLSPSGHKYW